MTNALFGKGIPFTSVSRCGLKFFFLELERKTQRRAKSKSSKLCCRWFLSCHCHIINMILFFWCSLLDVCLLPNKAPSVMFFTKYTGAIFIGESVMCVCFGLVPWCVNQCRRPTEVGWCLLCVCHLSDPYCSSALSFYLAAAFHSLFLDVCVLAPVFVVGDDSLSGELCSHETLDCLWWDQVSFVVSAHNDVLYIQ